MVSTKKERYNLKRETAALASREMTAQGQEIGDIPAIVNRRRRAACKNSLAKFCKTYFPEAFVLPWSTDHRIVIQGIENAVLNGERQAIAMPRGSGKTTLLIVAVMWAALYGHRRFIVLIAANSDAGVRLLDNIKVFLETSPRLMEDFPEVCYPVRKLERIVSRQRGQKYHGEHTRIQWTNSDIKLPTITGSKASGVIISATGMNGGDIRGQQSAGTDGTIARPDLVLIDDPQTRATAKSETQNADKVQLLQNDILGMAGPGKSIAGLMACTVIYQNDMADQVLDNKQCPEWRGKRTKLLYKFPDNMELWEDYKNIRDNSFANGGNGEDATDFYRSNRAKMEEGAVVAWKDRYDKKKEISALQCAMNLFFKDRNGFFSEYQNEPVVDENSDGAATIEEILAKCDGIPQRALDFDTQKITMFVDVHEKLLYWMIVGWKRGFSGHIIDYGTYPHVPSSNFKMRDVKTDMRGATGILELEGAVRYALENTIDYHMEEEFIHLGLPYRIDRIMVDGNYAQLKDVVYSVCLATHAPVYPSHGVGITPGQKTFAERTYSKGDIIGTHWKIPAPRVGRPIRHVDFDTNFWKTFVHNRLKTCIGAPGSITLYGENPIKHLLLASHLTAETVSTGEMNGRRADVWSQIPDRDNHWFDCLVGCSVAASIEGIELNSTEQEEVEEIDISEWGSNA